MTVYKEWRLEYEYRPQNLSKEACYRYECLVKYRRLREKGFSEQEALEFLGVKRSTYFNWLKSLRKNFVFPANSGERCQTSLRAVLDLLHAHRATPAWLTPLSASSVRYPDFITSHKTIHRIVLFGRV